MNHPNGNGKPPVNLTGREQEAATEPAMTDRKHVKNHVGELVIPGRNGGTLRNGGTNRGGPGRPPDEFKQRMRTLASLAAKEKYAGKIIRDINHPHWLGAVKWVTEQGYGKPEQTVKTDGKITIEIVRRALPRPLGPKELSPNMRGVR